MDGMWTGMTLTLKSCAVISTQFMTAHYEITLWMNTEDDWVVGRCQTHSARRAASANVRMPGRCQACSTRLTILTGRS